MVKAIVNAISSDGISKMLKQSLPAFSSEIRLKILSTLYENKDGLTYEQLRNKINVKKSNKFAYHINKLMLTPLVLRYLDFKDKSGKKSLYKISEYGKDLLYRMNSMPDIHSEKPFSFYHSSFENKISDLIKHLFEEKNYIVNMIKAKETIIKELEEKNRELSELLMRRCNQMDQNSWSSVNIDSFVIKTFFWGKDTANETFFNLPGRE